MPVYGFVWGARRMESPALAPPVSSWRYGSMFRVSVKYEPTCLWKYGECLWELTFVEKSPVQFQYNTNSGKGKRYSE